MYSRKIANFEVSPVGLGCMGFSHAYGLPTEKSEAVRMIRMAYYMGYTFFDTAEAYTGSNPDGTISYNEELVGEALHDIRDKVIIATKFGIGNHGLSQKFDSSPAAIRKSVEGSLKRLGTDYIDLYYEHRQDPNTPVEVVAEEMAKLIKEGKIRAWGMSEVDEYTMRKAHAVCPVAAIQNRYSMMARYYERLFPVFEELGIAYVAYSPLANGLLSGKYSSQYTFDKADFRANMPQYKSESFIENKNLFNLISNLAEEKNCTMSQLSLAWMLCKKPWIIPIPGSRKEERIRENLGAADVILSKDDVENIDAALSKMKMSKVFVGTGKQ